MSLDAIQKVTEAEQAALSRKAEAEAEARRMAAEAQRAGRERLEARRTEAEAQVKELMAQAEVQAARRERELLEENERACAALRDQARQRLDQAAELIVGRVVKS